MAVAPAAPASFKLDTILPTPFPDNISKYVDLDAFPNIPGGQITAEATEIVQSFYGHLPLSIMIWFMIGGEWCKQFSNNQCAMNHASSSDNENWTSHASSSDHENWTSHVSSSDNHEKWAALREDEKKILKSVIGRGENPNTETSKINPSTTLVTDPSANTKGGNEVQCTNAAPPCLDSPDLTVNGFDPFLIRYGTTNEDYYLKVTLATLNNIWCGANWAHKITFQTEKPKRTNGKFSSNSGRLDILTNFNFNITIPDFWGYLRFKLAKDEEKLDEQTSGLLTYHFKNFKLESYITTKTIARSFRTTKHKFRAPDIKVNYSFDSFTHDVKWSPFVERTPAKKKGNTEGSNGGTTDGSKRGTTEELEEDTINDDDRYTPDKNDVNIDGLTRDRIKEIVNDIVEEKIQHEGNRQKFLDRYIRSILIKLIPRVVEECKTKIDVYLSFMTVLLNGTDDDLYTTTPEVSKVLKLGTYSVMQKPIRDKIMEMLKPHFKLPEDLIAQINEKENELNRMRELRQEAMKQFAAAGNKLES